MRRRNRQADNLPPGFDKFIDHYGRLQSVKSFGVTMDRIAAKIAEVGELAEELPSFPPQVVLNARYAGDDADKLEEAGKALFEQLDKLLDSMKSPKRSASVRRRRAARYDLQRDDVFYFEVSIDNRVVLSVYGVDPSKVEREALRSFESWADHFPEWGAAWDEGRVRVSEQAELLSPSQLRSLWDDEGLAGSPSTSEFEHFGWDFLVQP